MAVPTSLDVLVDAGGASGSTTAVTNRLVPVNSQTTPIVVVGGANILDCSLGNYFEKTVYDTTSFSFSNVPTGGYALTLEIILFGGALQFPATVKFVADVAPVVATGKRHVIVLLTSDGGLNWRGINIGAFTI